MPPANAPKPIEIIHEDAALLVLNKPAGLAVHGGAGQPKGLIERLRDERPSEEPLQLVHRLDRGTSGVLLVAQTMSVAKRLSSEWSKVQKRYLAVALGDVEPQIVDRPLRDKEGRSQSARTEFHKICALSAPELADSSTLVLAELHTGRTHQIRRHLADIQHPVLMDDRHGDFGANKRWSKGLKAMGLPKPKHLMLHAFRLALVHPSSGSKLTFQAPLSERWQQIIHPLSDTVDALEHIP